MFFEQNENFFGGISLENKEEAKKEPANVDAPNPFYKGVRIRDIDDLFPQGFSKVELDAAYARLYNDPHDAALICESPTMEELDYYNPGTEEVSEDFVLEAITVDKFSKTEKRMAAVVRVFNKHLSESEIKALPPIVGKPKQSGGFAYVIVQLPFSDGQTVNVVFHSPEGDKKNIAASDTIIAFRWLLNKRDITQVVAPEDGKEISLETIAKRITQLVVKNSAKFEKQQKAAQAERQELDKAREDVKDAEERQNDLMDQIAEIAKETEAVEAQLTNTLALVEKQKAINAELQAKIDAFKKAKEQETASNNAARSTESGATKGANNSKSSPKAGTPEYTEAVFQSLESMGWKRLDDKTLEKDFSGQYAIEGKPKVFYATKPEIIQIAWGDERIRKINTAPSDSTFGGYRVPKDTPEQKAQVIERLVNEWAANNAPATPTPQTNPDQPSANEPKISPLALRWIEQNSNLWEKGDKKRYYLNKAAVAKFVDPDTVVDGKGYVLSTWGLSRSKTRSLLASSNPYFDAVTGEFVTGGDDFYEAFVKKLEKSANDSGNLPHIDKQIQYKLNQVETLDYIITNEDPKNPFDITEGVYVKRKILTNGVNQRDHEALYENGSWGSLKYPPRNTELKFFETVEQAQAAIKADAKAQNAIVDDDTSSDPQTIANAAEKIESVEKDIQSGLEAELDRTTDPNAKQAKKQLTKPIEQSEIEPPKEEELQATRLAIPGRQQAEDAKYELLELDDIQASHLPELGFQKNPKYGLENERRYHAEKASQEKVLRNALNLNPDFLLRDSVDANNGAPVVDQDNNVLGGNGRAMSIRQAYISGGKKAEEYKAALIERAVQLGFKREQVEAMKQPVLVRRLATQYSEKERQDLISALNDTFTDSKNTRMAGKSRGDRFGKKSLEMLAVGLQSADSLREFFDQQASIPLVEQLIKDGVIQQTERNALINAEGLLNPDGKTIVEEALRGRIARKYDTLAQLPGDVVSKIDAIAPSIIIAEMIGGDWNLTDHIRDAVELMAEYKTSPFCKKDDFHTFLKNVDMLKGATPMDRYSKTAVQIFLMLLECKKAAILQRFKAYSADAQHLSAEAGGLPGISVTAQQSAKKNLGIELEPNATNTATPQTTTEPQPEPEPGPDNQAEPEFISTLQDILGGKYDNDTKQARALLRAAIVKCKEDGTTDQYESILTQASDYLVGLMSKKREQVEG